MALNIPASVVAGEFVDENDWNAMVDSLTFLANPPACRVSHSTTQSLTNNTEASIVFDSESYDTNSMHSTASNTNRITINTAGLYVVSWGLTLTADNDFNFAYSYVRLNGAGSAIFLGSTTGTLTDSGMSPQLAGCGIYKFALNDWIEVRAAQKNTSAGANNVTTQNYFAATWVGLGT